MAIFSLALNMESPTMHPTNSVCLALFATGLGPNWMERGLCLQSYHSSRNIGSSISVTSIFSKVTLIFSKVKSDYIRALPTTPHVS